MRLEPSDVQRDLALAVRKGLDGLAVAQGRPDPADVHGFLTEFELLGLELPGPAGGLAFGLADAVGVCEELGRRAAADSYRAGTLAAELLLAGGQDDAAAEVGAGRAVAVHAVGPGITARAAGDAWALSGRCALPDARPDAAFYVVPALCEGAPVLAAVASDAAGVGNSPGCRDGVRGLVLTDAAPVAFSEPLRRPDRGPGPLLARARIRQAAYLVGLAAGAHRLAIERAAGRRQFGTAIGERQAVAFPLAEQYAHLEAARLLVRQAAWTADAGRDAALGATQALAYAAESALRGTAHAVHVHGAAGLTREQQVGRFYEVAGVEATRWGAPTVLWREAGALRLR
jgi:alkylation response protein AidB-like acyl-CoA dehydrogenase